MPYNGNRFSLTLFSSIGDLLGPLSGALMPSLAILMWVGGLFFFSKRIYHRLNSNAPWTISLLVSLVIIFLTLYQAPSIHQILYWRSGMLPYLAPMVLCAFLAGFIADQGKQSIINQAGVFGLAFLTAGFSEIAAMVVCGALLSLIVILFLQARIASQTPLKLHSNLLPAF
jgi:hypothetical protein